MPEAAVSHGVTVPTVRKWLGRYLAGGATSAGGRVIPASTFTARHRRGQGVVDRGIAPTTHAAKAARAQHRCARIDCQPGAGTRGLSIDAWLSKRWLATR